jgi:hypothetical protein
MYLRAAWRSAPKLALSAAAMAALATAMLAEPSRPPPEATSPVEAEAAASAAKPRWVVDDFDSGIKTTELADGSLQEEPFDEETVTRFASDQGRREGVNEPTTTGSLRREK